MDNPASLTGQYLVGTQKIPLPSKRRKPNAGQRLRVVGARTHNLQNVYCRLSLEYLYLCDRGFGGGKSSLVIETLYKGLAQILNDNSDVPGPHERIEGIELINKIVDIDQSPIGRTPRSNPATYTGVFYPYSGVVCGLAGCESARIFPRAIFLQCEGRAV